MDENTSTQIKAMYFVAKMISVLINRHFSPTFLVDVMLQGSVGFQDSVGVTSTFPENTVQVVSAGKGIYQMEFNAGTHEAEKL